jgi:hypothetical protein
MNTRTLLILAAAGAIAVAPLVAATDAHADTNDDAFLSTLADRGIAAGTGAAGMIKAGHAVCADLALGDTPAGAIAMIAVANPNLTLVDAGYFTGAAVGAYCPALAPATPSTRGIERA